MGAVWFRFRTELRARWGGLVAVALLAGLAGGVTLAAIAGARRTDTAYPRLAAATETYDVLVNPNSGSSPTLRRKLPHLPQVAQVSYIQGMGIIPVPRGGLRTLTDAAKAFSTLPIATDGKFGYTFGRPKITEGHMPDRRRPDDVWVDTLFARRYGLRVGSRFTVIGITRRDIATNPSVFASDAEILRMIRTRRVGEPITLRVVGVGVLPDQIVYDQGYRNAIVLLTPAFRARHDVVSMFVGWATRLHGGARAIPSLRRAVERLDPDQAIAFQTEPVTAATVHRAVQPYVGALSLFAIVVGATGLLLVGQAMARQSFLASVDTPTLSALGLSRAQLLGLGALRTGLVAAGAAGLAVVVAFLASPLLPLGPARTAEPDPGLSFDGLAIGLGALAVALAVVALAAYPVWRAARAGAAVTRDEGARPSRVAAALAASGAPASTVAGVRMALEPGRGRTSVPIRTTIVTFGLALTVVLGAAGVAASIDHLVDTPRLFGWNWDLQVQVSKSTPKATAAARVRLAKALDATHSVTSWSTLLLSDLRMAKGAVPAVGIDPARPEVTPSLASGRLPRANDEVALGARTLRSLGAHAGSRVVVRDNAGRPVHLTVVGRVVLPGIGTYPGSDKTALGEGAVVTEHALRRLGPRFDKVDYVLRLEAGATAADRRAVLARMERATRPTGEGDEFSTLPVLRSSDILSYRGVRDTPLVLALVLTVLALATVTHALVTGVQRRRRDLALLSTLGFTRRQIYATVAWQATTVALAALVIGVVLGISLGRTSWNLLADNLGTVAEPVVPTTVIALAIPVVLALTNLVALIPARSAARLRPAAVLRSE